jgi:hypothetical protein
MEVSIDGMTRELGARLELVEIFKKLGPNRIDLKSSVVSRVQGQLDEYRIP